MKKRVVYLEINSWKGMSFGAVHYYGRLFSKKDDERTEIRLFKELSVAEAKYLSKKDDWDWEVGDNTERFRSKDELIHLALMTWQEHFPDGFLLIQGNHCIAEPQIVIDGPEDLRQQISTLARMVEKERSEEAVWAICEKWDKIAEQHQIEF